MNTSKTIENRRKVGGDYFFLFFLRTSNLYLKDFIDKFNFNNYYCFKSTRQQILILYEDFLKFECSSYVFFKKDLYDLDHILKWVKYMKKIGGIMFLVKPLPPFSPEFVKIK